jgi:hypothetical protein
VSPGVLTSSGEKTEALEQTKARLIGTSLGFLSKKTYFGDLVPESCFFTQLHCVKISDTSV